MPTTNGGGNHGHVYLLMTSARYHEMTGNDQLSVAKQDFPGKVGADIGGNDSSATIARKTAERAGELETYYTQDGCEDGLKELIELKAPKNSLRGIKDRRWGLANVSATEMMEHLRDKAEDTDSKNVVKLMNERDKAIDWEGEVYLEEHFDDATWTMKQLKADHNVSSSHSDLIQRLLAHVEEDQSTNIFMKEAIDKWTEMSANKKSWETFTKLFGPADKKRRKSNKKPSNGGHSINNVNDVGPASKPATQSVSAEDVATMLSNSLNTFAGEMEAVIDDSINACVESKLKGAIVDSGASKTIIKESDELAALKRENAALLKKLAAASNKQAGDEKATLKRENAALAKKLAEANKGTPSEGEKKRGRAPQKKCDHCNQVHGPDCWIKNPEKATMWWLRKMPEKNAAEIARREALLEKKE